MALPSILDWNSAGLDSDVRRVFEEAEDKLLYAITLRNRDERFSEMNLVARYLEEKRKELGGESRDLDSQFSTGRNYLMAGCFLR